MKLRKRKAGSGYPARPGAQSQTVRPTVTVQQRRSPLRRVVAATLQVVHLGMVVNLLTSARYLVQGDSMEPTLTSGQYVLVSRLDYWLGQPRRGDLVLVRDPVKSAAVYVKRLVALPGEHLRIEEGQVFIDDRPLDEPYLAERRWGPPGDSGAWTLGEDECFVMGDHRAPSRDSRAFGPVKRDHIIGRLWLRLWPLRAYRRIPL
ncbi:MAG: signal peptidase I [Chloroflexi bacterium]|nr:signal peptidase I [Chloroflexota bacterium]